MPNFTDGGTKSYSCKITKAELKAWKSWFELLFKIYTFIHCVILQTFNLNFAALVNVFTQLYSKSKVSPPGLYHVPKM